MNNCDQEINDIISAVENIQSREDLLRNSDLLKRIGIFVLLIGKLENRVKTVLSSTTNPPPNVWDMTLGVAIKELGNRLPEIRDAYIRNSRDFRYKNFLQGDNTQLFVGQCDKLNKLRNDLIHNFVSPKRSGLKNIPQILEQVEKMIVGADNWELHRRERIPQEILKGQQAKDSLIADQLHIRTPEGDIREDLPLDGLIEICDIFYHILKQLK